MICKSVSLNYVIIVTVKQKISNVYFVSVVVSWYHNCVRLYIVVKVSNECFIIKSQVENMRVNMSLQL